MSQAIQNTAFLVATPMAGPAGGRPATGRQESKAGLTSGWVAAAEEGAVDASLEWKACYASLDACRSLEQGWDSYSAPGPTAVAIDNAKALIAEVRKLGIAPPDRVEPSAMGGIGVTFAAGHREVAIEFYNKGTAHALFSDDATGDMQTQAVATDLDGRRRIIREVQKYLYAE